ncbi:MAG TPA: hypothetical protein DCR95_02505 [Desulfobacter sp.]|nr:hypothetical protein [Desulfobacter sp.]
MEYRVDNTESVKNTGQKESPKISVIVPTYNYGQYIGKTLESVLNQTYQDFEIVVVDDGSEDDTAFVVRSFDDSKVRYIYQENQGACVARNRGIQEAAGEFLLFEDADDLLEPEHLEEYLKVAQKNPGCNIYGPAEKIRIENGKYQILQSKGKCPEDDLLEQWIGHWSIWSNCILWPRKTIEAIGGWDETLHANQDGDIAMRALIAGIRFVYAENAPRAKYLRHDAESGQISSTLNEKTLDSKIKTLEKVERLLLEKGALTRKYKTALGQKYYWFSRMTLNDYPEFSDRCFSEFRRLCGFRKPQGSYLNWIMTLIFGLRRKERISACIKR